MTGIRNPEVLHLLLSEYTVFAKKSEVLNMPNKKYGKSILRNEEVINIEHT